MDKNITKEQKTILSQAGKDPSNWTVTKHIEHAMYIKHKRTGKETIIVL